MRRPGEALSRVQLLDGAWDIAFESRSNVVDVYVRYLREKIDRPFGRDSLETVRGVGYRLRADGGDEPLPIRLRLTLPFARRDGARARRARGSSSTSASATRCSTSVDQTCARRPPSRARVAERRSRCSTATPSASRATSPRCSARAARSLASTPPGCRPAPRRGACSRPRRADAARFASGSIAGVAGDWRLLARPAQARRPRALVLARSLDARDETLDRLRARVRSSRPRWRSCSRSSPATGSPAPRCGRSRRCGGAPPRSRRATPGSRLPVPPARDEISRLAETLNDMLDRLEAAFEHERALRRRREPRAAHAARAAARPSSSSRCAGRARRTSSSRRCARRPRRPSG